MGKIILQNQIKYIRNKFSGKSIIAACGCFDIFHIGHLDYLKGAKLLGDILFVGVNSDLSILKIKNKKPNFNIEQRMSIISSLVYVDYVFSFNEKDFIKSLKALKPQIFARGVDADIKGFPEQKIIEEYHIKVEKVGDYKKSSSKELRTLLQDTSVNSYE